MFLINRKISSDVMHSFLRVTQHIICLFLYYIWSKYLLSFYFILKLGVMRVLFDTVCTVWSFYCTCIFIKYSYCRIPDTAFCFTGILQAPCMDMIKERFKQKKLISSPLNLISMLTVVFFPRVVFIFADILHYARHKNVLHKNNKL